MNPRTVRRWRAGATPGSAHLLALIGIAADLGLLDHLLPDANEKTAAANDSSPPRIDQISGNLMSSPPHRDGLEINRR